MFSIDVDPATRYDIGLWTGANYYGLVQAYNADGPGIASDVATVITPPGDVVAPGTGNNLLEFHNVGAMATARLRGTPSSAGPVQPPTG